MPVEVLKGADVIQEAGSISKITVESGMSMYVYNKGTVSELILRGGSVYIEEDGTLGSAIVNGGGICISAGGSAESVRVSAGGSVSVRNGGTVDMIYWTPGDGHLSVQDGAEVNYASSYSGVYYGSEGILQSHSEKIQALQLGGSKASAFVMASGVAEDLTLQRGGTLYVYSGGYADDIIFENAGNMYIYSGGTASDITVTEGGHLYISSGASALNVVWTPGIGTITVIDGGYITYADKYAGIYLNSNGQFISSALTMSDQILNSRMDMFVMSNGKALNLIINSGGNLVVSSGGSASINFNPWQGNVSSAAGAKVDFLQRDAGFYYGSDRKFIEKHTAVLTDFEVASNTELFVYDGAEGTNISAKGGTIHQSGGILKNASAASNGIININGGTASNAVAGKIGRINLNGGTAVGTVIDGGNMYVANDGKLSDTDINSGILHVVNSGSAAGTVLYAGSMVVSRASASNVILSSGSMSVAEGNVTDIILSGGSMAVSSGGNVSNVSVNSGAYMYIGSNASASGNILNDGGRINVGRGGKLENIEISGGKMVVSSGGTATAVYWTPCVGDISVMDGAYISFANEISGVYYGAENKLIEHQNNIKNKTVEQSVMYVMNEGNIANAVIGSAGSVYMSGGSADSTTVNSSGFFHIYNGKVENTIINKDGNVLVYSGGTFGSMQIASGGSLNLNSGAVFSGTMQISEGAVVKANKNAAIIFDVAERTVTDGWIINNLAWINGTPEFRISVSAAQEYGSYKLAQGAADFNTSISVFCNAEKYGTLTINDKMVHIGDKSYTLVLKSGDLLLTVAERDLISPEAPEFTVSNRELTNQTVTISATFSADSYLNEYSRDGSEWFTYTEPLVFETNGIVYLRSTDISGNISEIVSYEISNIDKEAPSLEINADKTEWTNTDVVLTATASDGVIEYFDGESWIAGKKMTVETNGTYTFRVTDVAGNITEKTFEVANIDKVAPTLEITGNAVEWTNKDIMLTAVVSDGTVEFFNGEIWLAGNTFTISENGTYRFKVSDEAGNVTEQEVIVDKIDKTAPTLEINADKTAWTNTDVILTASASDGIIEYFDGESWIPGENMTVETNGTYTFRVTDVAGNVTEKTFEVANIDKVAPTLEITGNAVECTNKDIILTAVVSDGTVEFFNGEIWLAGNTFTISENGTYRFKVSDEAGNVTEQEVIVDKIDKIAPTLEITADKTEWTNTDVILTASASDGIIEYFDGENWISGENMTVENNGTYTFRVTDVAGNVTEKTFEVTNINKEALSLEITADKTEWTNTDVILTASASDGIIEYFDGENWIASEKMTVETNGTYTFRVTDVAGNITEKTFEVTNIDKVAPEILLESDTVNIIPYADVKVSVNESATIYFSSDNESWEIYDEKMHFFENGIYYFKAVDIAGNEAVSSIEFNNLAPLEIAGLEFNADRISWVTTYKNYKIVELVNDKWNDPFIFTADSDAVDIFGMDNGIYQCRVRLENSEIWSENVTFENTDNLLQAEKFISETNGDTDLFFGVAKGVWNDKFNAERQGFYRPGDYKEKVSLNGKNKITDIFCGSEDANILILTDDLNGDALFVEDVFSAFGEDARLSNIDKILAGAGDDIIDMTGWRFEYISDGMIIDGGDGNDVIWAGTGNDIITGGAGNDRMHGGGGTDIFCFGGDFGNDTVDQADDGKIILCFADSNYTWDAEKRVCCYGSNTVTVLGAAEVEFSDKLPL